VFPAAIMNRHSHSTIRSGFGVFDEDVEVAGRRREKPVSSSSKLGLAVSHFAPHVLIQHNGRREIPAAAICRELSDTSASVWRQDSSKAPSHL